MKKTYRQGIVAVLVNRKGQLLICERSDHKGSWGFPQGGIEKDETPRQALFRELEEELGCKKVRVLRRSRRKVRYEFPPEVFRRKRFKKKHSGQEQVWFLAEFLPRQKPNLRNSDHCFTRTRWVRPERALHKLVEWKKPAFAEGLRLLGINIEKE